MKDLIYNIFLEIVNYNYSWLAAPHRSYDDVVLYTLFELFLIGTILLFAVIAAFEQHAELKKCRARLSQHRKIRCLAEQRKQRELEQFEREVKAELYGEPRVEFVGSRKCDSFQEMFENLPRA